MKTKDTNPKAGVGRMKPPVGLVPPVAILNIAQAFRDGAAKYGPYNWRKDPVSITTYLDAMYRHIMAYQDGEERSQDADVHHLAHVAACACILMDAASLGVLVDDRPSPGKASETIAEETERTRARSA
jgi:hypothetical protein